MCDLRKIPNYQELKMFKPTSNLTTPALQKRVLKVSHGERTPSEHKIAASADLQKYENAIPVFGNRERFYAEC